MKALLKKTSMLVAVALVATCFTNPAFAEDNDPHLGDVSGRSVLAGLTSLIIWPGIGQAINSEPGDKVATHAVIGLLPPYRFWSAYDALFDREGGYWKGRI